MTNIRKEGDVLHLDEFHIYDMSGEAVGFNKIGPVDLIRAGRELGRKYGVSEVRIVGGKRVTGANVGRRHRVNIKVPGSIRSGPNHRTNRGISRHQIRRSYTPGNRHRAPTRA